LLKIGFAQQSALKLPPIEWAKALADDLIYSLEFTVPHLIKDMCDEKDNRPADIGIDNFLAHCAWVYWRAPKAKSRPKADSKLNYRSPLKRAILVQLTRNYRASGLEVCRALDDEGAVELPADWSVGRNRSYEVAYKDRILRSRIEAMISKVRADMGTLLR
jgi:hypothetical protein